MNNFFHKMSLNCLILHLVILIEVILSNAESEGNFIKDIYKQNPEFIGIIPNQSVAIGRDAIFTCNVKNLGPYKVGWVKSDTKAIQTLHEKVITHNTRIKITGDFTTTFNLHITNVKEEDKGQYMCQLNTNPMIFQSASLDVMVPPDIDNEKSSADIILKTGSTAKLECQASGYPKPRISWIRDKKFITLNGRDGNKIKTKDPGTDRIRFVDSYDGPILTIPRVTADDLGAYLCIAKNGVQPSMSKRVVLNVQYVPQVSTPEPLIGAEIGRSVQLKCKTSAYPKALIYWRHGNKILLNGTRNYKVTETRQSNIDETSILTIKKVRKKEMGKYECNVKNSLGESMVSIQLYRIPSSATKSLVHETTSRSSSSSMSAGRKTGSSRNIKNLKMESEQSLYSTPSGGRKHSKQKKKATGMDNNIEYINVINEETMYGTYESSNNAEAKDRYTVSNDNYINAQGNFANYGVCTINILGIISLHLLNHILV